MKIAIDTQTTLGQKSGFGFYVKNLIDALKKVDPKNQYILISPNTSKDFSTPKRFIWDQFRFPKEAKKSKIDILHQPCFSAPIFFKGKIIVTVHDLISMHFPKNLPFASRFYYSRWMPFSYRKADKIIAISENTKKDIIDLLKIPENKIRVIHSAVGNEFMPVKDMKKIQDIKKRYSTGKKFILDVGTLEPRKNYAFLIKAYHLAILKEKLPHNLVLTGKKGWYYEGLFKLVKDLKLEKRVVFSGYVPEKDLPLLYSAADLFVFPSLYEGFGFPPLEAMACGTPVIASNTSSIPEVVGSAGILLPPKDEKRWAKEIIKISLDKRLAQNLSKKGSEQAKKFSWEKTAAKTIEVYKEVLESTNK